MKKVILLSAVIILMVRCGNPTSTVTPSIEPTPSSNPDMVEPVALPDAQFTPSNILTTDPNVICVSGYTKTVRVSLTAVERAQVNTEYNWTYGVGKQEYDHLIPLELGGGNGVQNIWPEPINEAHIKDRLENELHAKACSIHTTAAIQAAQSCIKVDWYACWIQEGKP